MQVRKWLRMIVSGFAGLILSFFFVFWAFVFIEWITNTNPLDHSTFFLISIPLAVGGLFGYLAWHDRYRRMLMIALIVALIMVINELVIIRD